ncbi:DNA internalization-related competence protein ComEC/Rec2 [Macrococcoides caseolyticum]|uniref:DNA internalization-related competence protein ComEC/Rec2 n=1 Tax=Macrococcoides caseolyticum TaxID=69966 RepID=UPI001F2896FF|nr:DNA internalization-related competence protein ComEC/Rec2 [Macrococcus caseolyticus]MCE4956167.1 DNA internalization-related competence protein ComEC/Rec2 [Macrococcus caseolyticus]
MSSHFKLNDDYKIDGNLFMGTLESNGLTYQFFYTIKHAHEKVMLQNQNLSFYSCYGHMEGMHVLPNTNISGFDYDAYMFYNHQSGSIKLSQVDFSECKLTLNNMIEAIKHYRKGLALKMYHSSFMHKSYLIALTLGDTSYLTKDEMNVLKTLGIYHLYAISGSHVALISVQFYYLLRRFSIPIFICKSILLLLLPIYFLLTGSGPSVARATLFIILILINPWPRLPLTDILSLTFVINLIVNPYAIYDIGFQLSYAICFAFLLILPVYQQHSKFIQFFLINFISQIATVPILYYHFNQYYFIGFLTNCFYIPLFTFLIFPISTFYLLCTLFSIPTKYLRWMIDFSFNINDLLTKFFVQLPHFELVLLHQSILYYIFLMLVLLIFFSTYHKVKIVALMILIVLALSVTKHKEVVHFLDVGQGDAAIIEANHQTIMIDTGGKVDFSEGFEKRKNAQTISEKVTIPFLKYQGINTIDYLILSHPDADHFGETEQLIRENLVKCIIYKNGVGSEKYNKVIRQAKEKGITLIDVNQMNQFNHFQLLKLRTISPAIQLQFFSGQNATDENDDSIVVFLKYKHSGRNILFLADVSKPYESQILSQIKESIDIVKIGHHGSDTSTSEELLDRQPKVAVISAGRNNRFNHPHQDTITALQSHNIHIYNTQSVGRISIDLKSGTIDTQYDTLFRKGE